MSNTSAKKAPNYLPDPRLELAFEAARKSGGKHLSLSGMLLEELPGEIWSFENLEDLDLSSNSLKTLPQSLTQLRHLKSLDLMRNPIERLPNIYGLELDDDVYFRLRSQIDPSNVIGLAVSGELYGLDEDAWITAIRSLSNLRELIVGRWDSRFREKHPPPTYSELRLIDSLIDFPLLESLSIRGRAMPIIPESIGELSKLKKLSLTRLGLTSLPPWLAKLNLEHLSAVVNRLTAQAVNTGLEGCLKLKFLNLAYNPLGQIPRSIFAMRQLECIYLEQSDITEVPSDILHLNELVALDLSGNPIESPPHEVVSKGLDAIRRYWQQRASGGVDYLCEAKLIIVGEPGAGKTSLARKIKDPGYQLKEREPSTEGIDVMRWHFPTVIRTAEASAAVPAQRDFQVNIWDFGGQEIYQATHQFFLTRRSVYLLVCDDRKEDTDFAYWLNTVELLSDGSPLLIIQNEKQDRTRDINLNQLRANFPSSLLGALSLNLETNRGLDAAVRRVRSELERLPHIGVGLPASWKHVREALEKDPRDYIDLSEFLAICRHHGFSHREDKLQLADYLHDLGICLHFQNDPVLKNLVILKPTWGTAAVYRVIDDAQVIAARGQFSLRDLSRIWSEPKYANMTTELLHLMMKFQLCYALEDGQTFIAPQLLSPDPPPYQWNHSAETIVRYQYEFLPKGILTRFIVATNHLLAAANLVWKTGVVLEKDASRAEVIQDYGQRRITVRVAGANSIGMLAIVDDQLEKIHRSFPRLRFDRYLPCPCSECRPKPNPYAFPLANLQNMAAKGQPIQCYESGEMVDSAALIRNIFPGAEPPPPAPSPEVFVSYAWTPESEAMVDRVQSALAATGIQVIRDKNAMHYKDSIRAFMQRIGRGKAVVVVISEKYLKSENCMFELLEIARAGSARNRVFPIVLPDANIHKAIARVEYIKFWDQQIEDLDKALKQLRSDSLRSLQDNLTLFAEIRRFFDEITAVLADMNTLDSDFAQLITQIQAQLA